MAPYVETIREHSKAMIVLRAHNVEHKIWERIAKETKFFVKRWYINHLAKTLKDYELSALETELYTTASRDYMRAGEIEKRKAELEEELLSLYELTM